MGILEKGQLMVDYTYLSTNWHRWALEMGGKNISVSTNCNDCLILFSSANYSVHLYNDGFWWTIDTVTDRGQRQNGVAKLSSFDLVEKYLIWDWATTAKTILASGPLGANLAKQGYASGIKISQVKRGYKICSNDDCAILSVVNATIFSHLINKSRDKIEQMIHNELN